MARLLQQEPLANACRSIAKTRATVPPHCLSALDIALRQTADDIRLAGRPIERVVEREEIAGRHHTLRS